MRITEATMGIAQDFQVITTGIPATSSEWFRAQGAPESELSPLTENQKKNARAFHMSEQEYSRGGLLRKYAREREENEGRLLGSRVTELLGELGADYRLQSVARRGSDPGWQLVVEERGRRVWPLLYGPEVIAEVVDRGRLERLREQLFQAIGRSDALQAAS